MVLILADPIEYHLYVVSPFLFSSVIEFPISSNKEMERRKQQFWRVL